MIHREKENQVHMAKKANKKDKDKGKPKGKDKK